MFGLPKLYLYIAIALALIGVAAYVRHAWHQQYKDGYAEGVKVTEDAQAEVIARVKIENERRVSALKLESATLQATLEGKQRESELVANSLRDKLSFKRVCSSDTIRPGGMPQDTGPTNPSDGTGKDQRPPETFGSAMVELTAECQRSTDKLGALQGFFHELKANGF